MKLFATALSLIALGACSNLELTQESLQQRFNNHRPRSKDYSPSANIDLLVVKSDDGANLYSENEWCQRGANAWDEICFNLGSAQRAKFFDHTNEDGECDYEGNQSLQQQCKTR